jgi:adenylate kinase family enzyme
MAAAPSNGQPLRYLIDGFPRAIAQAEIFEKMVGEPDCVLYFNTPEPVCVARCLERAKTSGRSDDTEEIIAKRLKTYNDASKPVIDFYALKGRVREVDGTGSPDAVWNLTKATNIHRASAMA